MPAFRIAFLRQGEETEASDNAPLPVHDADKETRAHNIDRLLVSETPIGNNTNRDLTGSDAADQPTLSNGLQYHTLIWVMFKTGAADVNYIIEARNTDFSGAPLGTGWRQVATGTITGAANSWQRVVITDPNGLYYDQYRIRVQASSSTGHYSVILGVRR